MQMHSMVAQKIIWEKSLGGNESDILYDLLATPDNGFIIAGSSQSKTTSNKSSSSNFYSNKGNYDYKLWKLNSKGEVEWDYNFGGDDKDILQKVLLTRDGGFLLIGSSFSSNTQDKKIENFGGSDVWILKLNALGDCEWQSSIGGSGNEKFNVINSIKEDEYVLGITSESNKIFYKSTSDNKNQLLKMDYYGGADAIILSIDLKGNLKWYNNFGGKYTDEVCSLSYDLKNNLYVGINSNSNLSNSKKVEAKGNKDIWIIKLDENRKELSQYVFGGKNNEELIDMILFQEEILFVANINKENDSKGSQSKKTSYAIWFFVVNEEGVITNEKQISVSNSTMASSVFKLSDNEILVAANISDRDISEFSEYYLSSFDKNFNNLWDYKIENGNRNHIKKVISLRDKSIIVAGSTNSKKSSIKSEHFGNNDFWLIKIDSTSKEKNDFNFIEAFPNPTSSYVNVIIRNEYNSGTLFIYDISGRLIFSKSINKNTETVDLTKFPSGVYIINVATNNFTDSIKILKI